MLELVRNLSDSDHIYAKYNTDPNDWRIYKWCGIRSKIMGINFGINFKLISQKFKARFFRAFLFLLR